MAERTCEGCGELTRIKLLGKIRGKQLCKKCRSVRRKDRRQETKDQAIEEEREKIRELSEKQGKGYREANKKEEKRNTVSIEEPKIKGSRIKIRKEKSNAYLSFEERKVLLGILMRRGLSFEEAKESLNELTKEQERVRKVMKAKNKSEKQIEIKQQKLLEELWNS